LHQPPYYQGNIIIILLNVLLVRVLKLYRLSRLTPKNQISNISSDIRNGKANIIIGTHMMLADNIKFYDLGMMVIDEEQHFGVLQKEKLKTLKNDIHVISLSATPIPRTLQMSMLGIRDLSLIATPPIDRLPVITRVIPYDPIIIRDALIRENLRGGRSFYVAPRIKDLEDIEKQLKNLTPELKYVVAHGKMAPSVIDEIMSDFYDGKYDILLSTTIIESGIDIPAANTIIIHKSEILGLSGLYQLRGRVGRSKNRAYAYLVINNSKTMTQNAIKRLDIMQNIDSLGAGFTIASYDSDIRGFGNLLGDEQAGHVKEVGAELYQEMLENAIHEIKNIKPQNTFSPNIKVNSTYLYPK
jgi:transcription-repair coupling factor (superfamily II helicase)